MKKLIFVLFGFSTLIATIWLLSNWQGSNWQKNFTKNTGLRPPEGISYSPAKEGNAEFISPDGKLKLKYPADWLVIEGSEFLEMTFPQDWKENYDLKTLFLGQKFQVDGFAQVIVYQGNFNFPISEIIEKMHNTNREQGWQVTITDSEIEEKTGVFEARSVIPQSYTLHSKEKIIKEGEKNTYLIAFISLEQDWPEFSEEADLLLNSARIVQ
ncbi:MAG: hypothetical protein ABIG29_00415 [Candidatus Nealsonbacteria bacterium]